MIERHADYLRDLRARHAAELELMGRALAGRRPDLLGALRKLQRKTERETVRILAIVDGRVS